MCHILCTFDNVINSRKELEKPKIGPFVLFFSLNIMQIFRVQEMKFRGQF